MLTDKATHRAVLAAGWSAPGLFIVLVVFILAVTVFGPWIGELEGQQFPVTGKVVLSDVQQDAEGNTTFRMTFNKLRNCEFLGVTVKRLGVAVPAGPVQGEPGSNGTLAIGVRRSQLWVVAGPPPLDDLEIDWAHNCSVFWTTPTHAYP